MSFPPPRACDTHVHVIGPKTRFPLNEKRSYTPVDAPVEALQRHLDGLGLDRVVIVQPSIYGTDNACLVDALARLGDRARGVAVVDADAAPAELDGLHRAGVRGLRLNLVSSGAANAEESLRALEDAARLTARNNWHVQLFAPPRLIEVLAPRLLDFPAPLVIDHFGLLAPESFTGTELAALQLLLTRGKAAVKLSAPYRISDDCAAAGVADLARALFAANPDAVVWGSDWPHTPAHAGTPTHGDAETPYRDLDTGALLHVVRAWLPDEAMQNRLLCENPARIYDWPAT